LISAEAAVQTSLGQDAIISFRGTSSRQDEENEGVEEGRNEEKRWE